MLHYDVFLSYRRRNGSERAELLRAILRQKGYSVFMDTHDLKSGHFVEEIKDTIANVDNVVVLITEGCFSDVKENDIWVLEISEALRLQKKVIPIFFDGIKTIEGINLPKALLTLPSHNAVSYVHEYADAAYSKLFSFLGEPSASGRPDRKAKSGSRNREAGHRRKFLYISIASAAALIIAFSAVKLSRPAYRYHGNGFEVTVKDGLTSEQTEALTDILDDMQLVRGGSFLMGNYDRLESEGLSVDDDSLSAPQHKVTLSDFYIGKYEVTQKQWNAFMELTPCARNYGMSKPVDYLSWDDCAAFVRLLSEKSGLTFSLPTEAQWEFAARGGLSGAERELLYSGSDDPFVVGWIFVSPDSTGLHNVGLKTCNEIGLFDMTGNVSEWCSDYFGNYPENDAADPQGPSEGELRVIRGGDYLSTLRICKVTSRQRWFPFMKREATGLRLVINTDNQ